MNAKIFHDHLDECKQCRENPFGLCPVGQFKLAEAVRAATDAPAPEHPAAPVACFPERDNQ